MRKDKHIIKGMNLLFYRTLRYALWSTQGTSKQQKLPTTFLDKKVAKNLRDGFYTLRFTPKA
jgi:hypothetical protein